MQRVPGLYLRKIYQFNILQTSVPDETANLPPNGRTRVTNIQIITDVIILKAYCRHFDIDAFNAITNHVPSLYLPRGLAPTIYFGHPWHWPATRRVQTYKLRGDFQCVRHVPCEVNIMRTIDPIVMNSIRPR